MQSESFYMWEEVSNAVVYGEKRSPKMFVLRPIEDYILPSNKQWYKFHLEWRRGLFKANKVVGNYDVKIVICNTQTQPANN